jgi:hypothetical protein
LRSGELDIKVKPAQAPVGYPKATATVHDLAIGALDDATATTTTTTGRKK